MSEQRLFDTAVASLYETVLHPQHWSVAIAHVASVFDAPSAALFGYDFASGAVSDLRTHGLDPDVGQRYAAYYHQLDPGRSVAMAAPVGVWLADELLLDLRSQRYREYVHDFALPSGIGWVAGCKVTGDSRTCTYLSLGRRPGALRFGDASLGQYRALEPHLRRVSQMRTNIVAAAVDHALARACLDRLRAGMVVVDKARRIHMVNSHGATLLRNGHALSVSNRRLRCSTPSLDERLGRLIESACLPSASGGALRIMLSGESQGLFLNVVPIPQGHDLASLLAEPLALVVITDPAADAIPVDAYRALFALTAAEAALLAGLVAGTTVGEWARQRGVSVATVRTQLRSLFDKTGTDSQARLVAVAKSLAPIH